MPHALGRATEAACLAPAPFLGKRTQTKVPAARARGMQDPIIFPRDETVSSVADR